MTTTKTEAKRHSRSAKEAILILAILFVLAISKGFNVEAVSDLMLPKSSSQMPNSDAIEEMESARR